MIVCQVSGGHSPSEKDSSNPLRLYFDKPFLIYIKKREPAASPFFVMWIDNAELIQEFVFEDPN